MKNERKRMGSNPIQIVEVFLLILIFVIYRHRILNIFLYEKEYFLYEKNIQNPMSSYIVPKEKEIRFDRRT